MEVRLGSCLKTWGNTEWNSGLGSIASFCTRSRETKPTTPTSRTIFVSKAHCSTAKRLAMKIIVPDTAGNSWQKRPWGSSVIPPAAWSPGTNVLGKWRKHLETPGGARHWKYHKSAGSQPSWKPQGGMTHPRITSVYVGQIPMLSGEILTTLYILCITNVMQLYVYIHCCYIYIILYLYSLSMSVNPSLYLIYLQYLSRLFSPVLLFLSLFSSFLFSYLMVSDLNYWVFPYPSIRCSLQVSSNNLIISYPLIHRILSILVLCYHLERLSGPPKPQRKGLWATKVLREETGRSSVKSGSYHETIRNLEI